MAEAAVESPAPKFFCHKCFIPINPVLPDYICPECRLGFIEEYSNQNASDESDEELEGASEEFLHLTEVFRNASGLEPAASGADETSSMDNPFEMFGMPFPRARRLTGRRRRHDTTPRLLPQPPTVDRFLQLILTSLTDGRSTLNNAEFQQNPIFLTLHGNPGDYAWGRGNFDAIITQLLNQLDGTGPPPLSKDKIQELPTVEITQEQIEKNLQCTVCMEDFKVQEPVKRLKCDHYFHSTCIVPWLELHGTCPICRMLLNESETGNNGQSTGPSNSASTSGSANYSYTSPEFD